MESKPYVEGFERRLSKLAARPYLDIQVCDHCNLRCAGCLHFAPLAKERFLDLETYRRDLDLLASVEGVEGFFRGVELMGGEPLLHPQIAEVVRTTRVCLPHESIALCTNGLLLRRMDGAFWDALVECDVTLGLSPYPIKLDYEELAAFARTKGVRVMLAGDVTGMDRGKESFIRLALSPEGDCEPGRSFTACPFGGCYLQLSQGAIWPCQVAAHHGAFAQRFGYGMHAEPDDALPLAPLRSAGQIEDFRRRSHPMCRYCRNDALTVSPWGQSKLEAGEWLA